jgi:hypothetical protein
MTLDPSRIQSVLADTEDVQDALAKVLIEDEQASTPALALTADGLPSAQSKLLTSLLQKESWSRTEFEVLTREHGLMPDGAIEALNDWAFDNFEEPLIEEGNPLILSVSCVAALAAKNAEKVRA